MRFIAFVLIPGIFGLTTACRNDTSHHSRPAIPEAPANALFRLLPASETGVDFRNDINETEAINIFTYGHLYNGGGVAVIDVNNDQLPDLFFSSTTGACKLYLNKGQFKFEDITSRAGVSAGEGIKTGVAVSDVNNDGWADLLVCRSGPQEGEIRRNLLFINNKDNTFTESGKAFGIDDLGAHSMAHFFDCDADGDLDLYLVNTQANLSKANSMNLRPLPNGQAVRSREPLHPLDAHRLYRNDNGHFTDITASAGMYAAAFGLSAVSSDVNNDGYTDLWVGNDFIEPDYFYINRRNGTFTEEGGAMLRHMANQTMGSDIGDINNDGLEDMISVDMLPEDYGLQQQRVSSMKDERYYTLLSYGYGHQLMRNVLQLNNGFKPGAALPNYSDIACLAGVFQTDWSWAPLIQDFDNDGWRDVFISNGYYRDVTNADFVDFTMDSIGRITGGFQQFDMKKLMPHLRNIPSFELSNYAYRNCGAAASGIAFDNVSVDWGLAQPSFSNGAAYADVDNDGDLDLIVNNIERAAFIYKNTAVEQQKGHWLQLAVEGSPQNQQAIGAIARLWSGGQCRTQTLLAQRGFFSSVSGVLHFGLGAATTVDRLELQFPEGRLITLQHVPADQRLVLRFSEAKPGKLTPFRVDKPVFRDITGTRGLTFRHQENKHHDFDTERLLPWKLSQPGPCLAAADVNGDRLEDVFVGGANGQAAALLLQHTNGTFSASNEALWSAEKVYEDAGALFFDAEQDGDQDLLVASGGHFYPAGSAEYRARLYLNNGKGTFSAAPDALPGMTDCSAVVSARDLDADGDPDLIIGGYSVPGAYPQSPASHIWRNDKGRFTEVTRNWCPQLEHIGMVRALHWADLDGDGREELLVACEWSTLKVFSIKPGGWEEVTARYGLEGYSGFWRSIASADFDADGDMDLVCGNLGWNTRYAAYETAPLTLYAMDFDNNGSMDPLMGLSQYGIERPVAYRSVLLKQLPVLKKMYVRTQPYAQATMKDLVPKKYYDQAMRFRVNELATCYFENKGGRYSPRPLPIEAQVFPGNALLATDVDADGDTDLVLAGNDYGQQVETGRLDAGNGLLLLNDGKAGFSAKPARHSGLWADLDARSLCVLRTGKGKKILLVGNSDGVLQAFEY